MNEEIIIQEQQKEKTEKPKITLTEEQNLAVSKIKDWFENDKTSDEFKLGGYAGTGKTTIIKTILEQFCENHIVNCAAFTGKACSVLHRKGIRASTLHSLMYDVSIDGKETIFTKRHTIPSQPDLIIVDEASMISTNLYNDLKSFKKKYLFVGDPGQLEPVGDNPDLMRSPDFILNKIHRQAEQSPIIRLATSIRQGGSLVKTTEPNLEIRNKNWTAQEFMAHDQIICAKNKMRTDLNNRYRLQLKYPTKTLTIGDKIIVLRNNLFHGVFNGLILKVNLIKYEDTLTWTINATDEVENSYFSIPIWKEPFQNETFDVKQTPPSRRIIYADYGYVITCHKAQGSEWDKVLVIDELMPPKLWDMKRWRYTAITRAAKCLTYCI